MYLGQTLLVSMNQILGPVRQVFVKLSQCLGIIPTKRDLLPKILGTVSTLYRFDVEADLAIFLTHGCVSAVGEWTRGSIAQTGHAVWVSAKVSLLRLGTAYSRFIGAELVIDNLPYHLIVLHLKIILWARTTMSRA